MWSFLLPALLCFCVCSTASALKLGSGTHTSSFGEAVESATDFLLDAKMQIQQMDDLKKDVEVLAEDVKAGGDKARHGSLLSTPGSDATHQGRVLEESIFPPH